MNINNVLNALTIITVQINMNTLIYKYTFTALNIGKILNDFFSRLL